MKKVTLLFFNDGEDLLIGVFDCDGMNQTIMNAASDFFDGEYQLSVSLQKPDVILVFDEGVKRPCCLRIETRALQPVK